MDFNDNASGSFSLPGAADILPPVRPRMPSKALACSLTAARAGAVAAVLVDGGAALPTVMPLFEPHRRAVEMIDGGLFYGSWLTRPDGEPLDDVLLTTIPFFASDTAAPQIEIHFHGSPGLVADALAQLADAGAEIVDYNTILARAHLTGNITLIETEARIMLSAIRNPAAAQVILGHNELTGWIERLAMHALTAARVGHPGWREQLLGEVDRIRTYSRTQSAILRKWRVVLAGPRSAGKSSLFNQLIGRLENVVDPTPGVTRDAICMDTQLGDYNVEIWDTAGLLDAVSADSVSDADQQAQNRMRDAVVAADCVVWVIDGSAHPDSADMAAAVELIRRRRESVAAGGYPGGACDVMLFNKSDLGFRDEVDDWPAVLDIPDTFARRVSAWDADIVDRVAELIADAIRSSVPLPVDEDRHDDVPVLFTDRQFACADELAGTLAGGANALDVLQRIRALLGRRPDPAGVRALGEMLGKPFPASVFSEDWLSGKEISVDDRVRRRQRRGR